MWGDQLKVDRWAPEGETEDLPETSSAASDPSLKTHMYNTLKSCLLFFCLSSMYASQLISVSIKLFKSHMISTQTRVILPINPRRWHSQLVRKRKRIWEDTINYPFSLTDTIFNGTFLYVRLMCFTYWHYLKHFWLLHCKVNVVVMPNLQKSKLRLRVTGWLCGSVVTTRAHL